jgi:ribosome-associated protein
MTTRPAEEPFPPVPDEVAVAAEAASDKLGGSIRLLFVGEILSITDWFLIASAGSTRQVRTIADEVQAQVKRQCGRGPVRVEGLSEASWVLLDFADFVVHVFLEETRRYYDLERLWSDCPTMEWSDTLRPQAAGG